MRNAKLRIAMHTCSVTSPFLHKSSIFERNAVKVLGELAPYRCAAAWRNIPEVSHVIRVHTYAETIFELSPGLGIHISRVVH